MMEGVALKELSPEQQQELLGLLKERFERNADSHKEIEWSLVQSRLEKNIEKLWSLHEMERTGGEPDIVAYEKSNDLFIFCDCSEETPKGRRNVCYDREALDSRKDFKPDNNALDMASAMGIDILNEEQYRRLQELGKFDTKTSSWILTPSEIRKLGGAIFADRRYNKVFIYHNGASSYYASRGFRGSLSV